MIGDAIARRYAAALFASAKDAELAEPVYRYLSSIADMSRTNKHFQYFLLTAKVPDTRKRLILKELFGKDLPDLLMNFLIVVMENRRQKLLWQIAVIYRRLLDSALNRMNVSIATAIDLSDRDRQITEESLQHTYRKTILMNERIDDHLIGGMVIRIGNCVINGSIAAQLQRMRTMLTR